MSKGAIKVTRDGGVTWEIIDTIKGEPGDSAYQIWKKLPGNGGKTESEYASFLAQEGSMLWQRLTTNPASFYPVPQSPIYTRVSGEPIQTGTGDPAPDNIRPILPWKASGSAVRVRWSGKNLAEPTLPRKVGPNNLYDAKESIPLVIGQQYMLYINHDKYASGSSFYFIHPDGEGTRFTGASGRIFLITQISDTEATVRLGAGATYTWTVPEGIVAVNFTVYSAVANWPTWPDIQLEIGDEPTAYEPYSGEEITLTAPQDIYGGWMDNEGKGLITHANIPSYAGESVPTGWKSSVGSLSTGAQVVYPLEVPIPLTIAPNQLLSLPQFDRTVPRQNVVVTDAQGLRIDYAKSPIL